jgi:hypothetical protein
LLLRDRPLGIKIGRIAPKRIPIPTQKAKRIPKGRGILEKVRNWREIGVIFWMEMSAIAPIHPAIITALIKFTIPLIYPYLNNEMQLKNNNSPLEEGGLGGISPSHLDYDPIIYGFA